MRRLSLAVGLAAVCCLVVNAGTGVTPTGQPKLAGDMTLHGKVLQLADQPRPVRGYLGDISAGHTSRGYDAVAATAESTWDIVGDAAWEFNTANAGWAAIEVTGRFTCSGGPVVSTVGPNDKMLGANGIGSSVGDSDSSARADGTVTWFNVHANWVRFSYSYTVESKAFGVPDHGALAKAALLDPVPVIIGDQTGQLDHTHVLKAGSQVRPRDAHDPDAPPEMALLGRFGQGTFDGGAGGGPIPEVFWAEPAPAGAFDLYRIVISESTSGAIEADVTLFASPNPDYDVSFAMTAAEVKTAIESAGWVLDPSGVWVLPVDLLVVDAAVSATTPDNEGEDGAIGIQTSQEAFDAAARATVYNNTVVETDFGVGLPIGTEFGDELKMTGEGPLTNFSFSIVNFDAEDLYAVDIELRFYDGRGGMNFIGSYNLGTVSFPWPGGLQGGGWGATFDDLDLTTAGIFLPATATCTQILTNPVGSGRAFEDSLGPLIYDPPTIGASEDYYYWNGDWWWFGGDPVANFCYKVDMKDPIPPPPAVYDNTTGSAIAGFADVEGSWIGDDITLEDYGDPPNPPWALNYGMLDKFAWTVFNVGASPAGAGLIECDWTVEFFERSDPSIIIGTHTWNLDYGDDPLPPGYYSRWRAWALKASAEIPLTQRQLGIRCAASHVVWETHNKPVGEIAQVLFTPESVGNSNDAAFWADAVPKWGTDAGWYYFTDGTVADFYYRLDVLSWNVGDMNCDGVVNNFDIDPFVLALTQPGTYAATYPSCDLMNGDCDRNGTLNNFDIDPFVAILTG